MNTHALPDEPQVRTSQKQRWLYAATILGVRLPGQVVLVALLFFYTDVKYLSPAWASAAMAMYAIYNALNNPLLGYVQDRFTFGGRRRIPWIRYGAIPFMIFFAALWLPPFDGATQPLALAIYFFVTLVLYDTFGTAVFNAYYSLLPEMFVNSRERTDTATRMNIVLTVAFLLGVALPIPLSKAIGWGPMGILFAVIGATAIFIGLRGLFETGTVPPASLSFRAALRTTLVNRSFISVTFAQMLRFIATQTQATGTIFFIKYTLGLDSAGSTLVLTTVFVVTGLMAYPWRRFIADRVEPRTSALLAYLVTGASAASLWFVDSFFTTLLAAIAIGFGFAGLFLMDNLLISDVIDEDESRTGQRREAMYFGLSSMASPLASVAVSIAFGLFSTTFGYDPMLSVQPASVGIGFRLFVSIVPIIACLGAFVVLLFYPLHSQRLRKMRRTLAQRRSPKA